MMNPEHRFHLWTTLLLLGWRYTGPNSKTPQFIQRDRLDADDCLLLTGHIYRLTTMILTTSVDAAIEYERQVGRLTSEVTT